jgi:hypothetical protein
VLLIMFGGSAFHTTTLSATNWGYSLLIGAGSLLWNFLLPFIFPVHWIPLSWTTATSKDPEAEEEAITSLAAASPAEESANATNAVSWAPLKSVETSSQAPAACQPPVADSSEEASMIAVTEPVPSIVTSVPAAQQTPPRSPVARNASARSTHDVDAPLEMTDV